MPENILERAIEPNPRLFTAFQCLALISRATKIEFFFSNVVLFCFDRSENRKSKICEVGFSERRNQKAGNDAP
jgi:hypothetical protein